MNDEPKLRRIVELDHYDLGARRVDANRFESLIRVVTNLCEGEAGLFKVWRFNRTDILQIAADQVHTLINKYDVRSVEGRISIFDPEGLAQGIKVPYSFIDIDLSSSSPGSEPGLPAFRIEGDKELVDRAETAIMDEVESWPRTWHGIVHNRWWWLTSIPVGIGLMIAGGWAMVSPRGIAVVIGMTYVACLFLFVTFNAGTFIPSIWFYRPEGLIGRRRKIIWALTLGHAALVIFEVVGNILATLLLAEPAVSTTGG